MKRLVVFPLINAEGWTFRTSIADSERIMILAFGPKGEFMLRYYTDEDNARCWVDEVIAGKHIE